MVTRGKAGIQRPNPKYNSTEYALATFSQSTISPLSTSARAALCDPNWKQAMQAEFDALLANNTWTLVPPPHGVNVVFGKWVFRHKTNPDGSLDRYKAHWVVRGFSRRPGIDYGETYSPVVKPASIHTVLSIIASKQWPVRQLDVSNAFLNGQLQEQVYCQQPIGFVDPDRPNDVCLLTRSLYELKQAPRAWYTRFASFIKTLGFAPTRSDNSLFVLRRGSSIAYLLLYVDDIVLTASSTTLLEQIIAKLQSEFKLKDMGDLSYFLGIEVTRTRSGFFLTQNKYALELLDRVGMSNFKPISTPVDTKPKLSSHDGKPISDAHHYRSIVGGLQYLTMTRPRSHQCSPASLFTHA